MKSRNFALGGLIAILALMAAFFAVPAGAQDEYPPGSDEPSIQLSASTYAVGDTLMGSVENFPENTTGLAELNPSVEFAIGADGSGSFSMSLAGVAPGEHTLTVSAAGVSASTTVTIVAAQDGGATGGGGDLPRTGSDSSLTLAQTAIAAIAAGGLMVLVTRRRMTTA